MRRIQCDSRDFWAMGKGATFGVLLSFFSPFPYYIYLGSSSSRQQQLYNLYANMALEFKCEIDTNKFTLYCPQAAIADKILAFAEQQAALGFSSYLPFLGLLLSFGLIGAMWNLSILREQRQYERRQWEAMERRKKQSNLAELRKEAKELEAKYGELYKDCSKMTSLPKFLCEPEPPYALLTLPPIVCSDGYARGIARFEQMAAEGKISSRGIIDSVLLKNELEFLQNRSLPKQFVIINSKKNPSVRNFQGLCRFIKNDCREIWFIIFKVVAVTFATTLAAFFVAYAIMMLRPSEAKQNQYMLAHASEFNCSALVTSGFKKILLNCSDLLTQNALHEAAERNADPILFHEAFSVFFLIAGLAVGTAVCIIPNIYIYFSRQENAIFPLREEEEEDLENSGGCDISDRHFCNLSRSILKKPVISEDGFCYSEQMFEQEVVRQLPLGPTFKSPITFKSVTGAPIFWRYVQLENEISKMDIKPEQLRTVSKKMQ